MGEKSAKTTATEVSGEPLTLHQQDKGPARPFRRTAPPASQSKARSFNATDRICLPLLTVFAVIVRFYKIWRPTSVVFDEVHFGGFARKYIIGRFFMDVHPPLAKMLYAVVGWLAGYDGEFDFKDIGLDYLEPGVPYVAMRMLPATMGVFTIMLAYATLRSTGCRPITATFGAGLMTIDNALATQSRYILLDAPLVFFIAITGYGFKKFENEVPFTKDWFRYLFLTGLGLGATVSSKWVGIFTIGWIGFSTVYQLWWIWGDLSVSPKSFSKHFLFRLLMLVGVPVAFYISMFYLHFICVVNYGDGASFMSPEFQATLQHNNLVQNVPADVAYGSELALRHLNTRGGFLHSHEHMYETGSEQQQVTLYPHRDDNNIWIIEKVPDEEPAEGEEWKAPDYAVEPVTFVQDGDIVRLRHKATSRRLHSHDHRPPVSEQDHQNEVSAYGFDGFGGDANDNFRVEIFGKKSDKGVAQERIRTLETKFRLVHPMTGCALFSHSVKLPKWAFEQQEVTCIKQGALPNTLWFVEENSHPQLGADAELVNYRVPSFLEKFIELNKVMWNVNKGLTETHAWDSRPDSWPLLKRGINFWVKDHTQVYLLGNGIIWWSITAIVGLYVVFKAIWIIRWQRGYNDFQYDESYSIYDSGVGSFLLAWAFHYFPSFLMERQLFLHHYLGSLYFGILALTQFWEFLCVRLIRNKLVSNILTGLFFAAAGGFFYHYSPLIYGGPWTKETCLSSKFLDMDFDCNSFLDSYEAYDEYEIKKAQEAQHTTVPEPPKQDSILNAEDGEVEYEVENVAEPEEDVVPESTAPVDEDEEIDEADYDDDEDEEVTKVSTKKRPAHITEPANIAASITKALAEASSKLKDKQDSQINARDEAEHEVEDQTAIEENGVELPENEDPEPSTGKPKTTDAPAQTVVSSEKKIEYRDADGNLIPEDVVRSLEAEGKVSVNTKRTHRSRFVDADGNVVSEEVFEE